MSGSAETLLGIIAVATVVMALVQVGVIVAAAMVARRVSRLADQMEQQVKPLFAHLDAIGRDASRATALAASQVERVDRLVTDLTQRIEQTAVLIQQHIVAPAREGRAILAAIRTALATLRSVRENARRQGRGEDEDALFI